MQLEIGECFDDLNEALKSAIKAVGGFKEVGKALWPELLIDTAAQRLRDSVNPDRRDKLSPEQFIFVLRLAREKGFHAAMDFVAFDLGYKATPVDPVTQEAELQERFIHAVDGLSAIQTQLQRIQRMRAVA